MDWGSIFSGIGNFGSKLFSGNTLSNLGSLAGGAGSLYGAYNANRLGNKQMDLTNQQNKLMLDAYNKEEDDREKRNQSFSSVWGN